jgi:hypothetical protein
VRLNEKKDLIFIFWKKIQVKSTENNGSRLAARQEVKLSASDFAEKMIYASNVLNPLIPF